jgi:murein DD-endopeptidase MepM/ murein hydrolase activator NlpD
MSFERLAAPVRFIGLSLADTARRSSPQAVSALFAPAAMAVGAIGLTCMWGAMPHHTPQWPAFIAAQPTTRPGTPATGPDAKAALRQSTAISTLLVDLGAIQVTPPAPVALVGGPDLSLQHLRDAEADMISAADRGAQNEIDGYRRTFRTAGLNMGPYMGAEPDRDSEITRQELRNPRTLSVRFNIDMGLARRLQRTARDLLAVHTLNTTLSALPLAVPVDHPQMSSPFGLRIDPFRGEAAFHPGLDFAGAYGQPIHVTAPGVVSFVGQRSGYGNCVEVDHGFGFKTRYGHLSGFASRVGQRVNVGDVIARMGSTGRSTGVHLHYEVWANGKLQNPIHFLKAGQIAAAESAPHLRARG